MINIIFKRFLTNLNDMATKTSNKLDKSTLNDSNLINTISVLPKYNVFFYLILLLVFFIIFRNLEIKLSMIFGFLLFIAIAYFLIQKDHNDEVDLMEDNALKLKFLEDTVFDYGGFKIQLNTHDILMKPEMERSFLHYNSLIVELFYNVKSLTQLCMGNYVECIRYCNYVIGLHEDMKIGVENPFENLSVAKMFYKLAMNSYAAMIHSVIGNPIIFNKSIPVLQSILLDLIHKMRDICIDHNKKHGLSTMSIPNDKLKEYDVIEDDDTKLQDYNPAFDYF